MVQVVEILPHGRYRPIHNQYVADDLVTQGAEVHVMSFCCQGSSHYQGPILLMIFPLYCQISNISRTKSQTLNDSGLALQLSLPNPLKPGIKSGMKM